MDADQITFKSFCSDFALDVVQVNGHYSAITSMMARMQVAGEPIVGLCAKAPESKAQEIYCTRIPGVCFFFDGGITGKTDMDRIPLHFKATTCVESIKGLAERMMCAWQFFKSSHIGCAPMLLVDAQRIAYAVSTTGDYFTNRQIAMLAPLGEDYISPSLVENYPVKGIAPCLTCVAR